MPCLFYGSVIQIESVELWARFGKHSYGLQFHASFLVHNFQGSGCQWLTDAGFVYTLKKPKPPKQNILPCDLSHSTSMLSVQSAWPVYYLCVQSPFSRALGWQVSVGVFWKSLWHLCFTYANPWDGFHSWHVCLVVCCFDWQGLYKANVHSYL